MKVSLITKNVKNGAREISYPVKITYDDALAEQRIAEAPALLEKGKMRIIKQNVILFITLLFLYTAFPSYFQQFYSEVHEGHVILGLAVLHVLLWFICAALGLKDSFFAQCLFFKFPKMVEDFYSLNEQIYLMCQNYPNLFAVRVCGDKNDFYLEALFSDCRGFTKEFKIFLRKLQFEHKVGISEIEVDLVEGKITLPLASDSNRIDTNDRYRSLDFSRYSQLHAYSHFKGVAGIYYADYADEKFHQEVSPWCKNCNPFEYECKSINSLPRQFEGNIHDKICTVTRVFPQFVGIDYTRRYYEDISGGKWEEDDCILFTNALGMLAAVIVDFSEFEVHYRLDSNVFEIDFLNKKVICPLKRY